MPRRTPTASAPPSSDVHLIITRPVDRSAGRRDPQPGIVQLTDLRVTPIDRPLRLHLGDQAFLASAWALPVADASCDRITCIDVLEFVRHDDTLLAEFARVLRPGGTLHLRVPNTGPLEGIDPLNLYHYLVDILRKRTRPIETDEVGWHRHYSAATLSALLESQFAITSIRTEQVGVAATLQTVNLIANRWLLNSASLETDTGNLVQRVARLEGRLHAGRFGALLTVEATRADR